MLTSKVYRTPTFAEKFAGVQYTPGLPGCSVRNHEESALLTITPAPETASGGIFKALTLRVSLIGWAFASLVSIPSTTT